MNPWVFLNDSKSHTIIPCAHFTRTWMNSPATDNHWTKSNLQLSLFSLTTPWPGFSQLSIVLQSTKTWYQPLSTNGQPKTSSSIINCSQKPRKLGRGRFSQTSWEKKTTTKLQWPFTTMPSLSEKKIPSISFQTNASGSKFKKAMPNTAPPLSTLRLVFVK